MDRDLTGRLRVIRLLDTYGRLLTGHQQRLLALYYHDDLSLGEIAERLAVSRQAVFDTLRRSTGELEHLEDSLGVVARQEQARRRRQRLAARLDALDAALRRLAERVGDEAVTEIARELDAIRRSS